MQKRKSHIKNGAPARKGRPTGLGKGLDALFPDIGISHEPPKGRLFDCDIDEIRPNPYQPRRNFSEAEMTELVESVKARGILQPLLVRKSNDGFELIAGERRLRAARMAGLFKVPVIIKEAKNPELLELSVIENIQRENLNPMEEAEAYQRLSGEFKMTQEEIAGRVGKSRSAVANFLRLNQLADDIKATIRSGALSMGHARALLGAETDLLQRKAWHLVISQGLSVRETEKLVSRINSRKTAQKASPRPDNVYYSSLEEDLSRFFGTRVQIRRQGKKGRLEIEFYTDEDLDRLLGLLKM